MDTRHLEYVLSIAKWKNMTKAAEELYVSQSSLSQYISKLEQELGTPLFVRAYNQLVLTKAGEMYVRAASEVVSIKKNLYQNIHALLGKSHISLGITSQLGLKMLTTVIPIIKAQYPQVIIEITEGNASTITKLIQEENIDCAVMAVMGTENFSPSDVTILGEETLLLAVPKNHDFAKKYTKNSISWNAIFGDLKDANFLLSKKGSSIRTIIDYVFTAHDFQPNTMFQTNSILTTRAMVGMGIGVTFIGQSCVSDEDKIKYYRLNPHIVRQIAFVQRKNWVLHDPEQTLKIYIKNYFDQKAIQSLIR